MEKVIFDTDRSEVEDLEKLVESLVEVRGKFSGWAIVSDGVTVNGKRTFVSDEDLEELIYEHFEKLEILESNKKLKVKVREFSGLNWTGSLKKLNKRNFGATKSEMLTAHEVTKILDGVKSARLK